LTCFQKKSPLWNQQLTPTSCQTPPRRMRKCVQVNRNERRNPIRLHGRAPPLRPFHPRDLRPLLPDLPQKNISPKTPPSAQQPTDSIKAYTQTSVRNEFKTNCPQRPFYSPRRPPPAPKSVPPNRPDGSYETQSRSGSDRLPRDPSRLPVPVRSQHIPEPAPESRFSTCQTAKQENDNVRVHPNERKDRAGNVLFENNISNQPHLPSQLTEPKQPNIGSNLGSNPLRTIFKPRADPERTPSESHSDPIRTVCSPHSDFRSPVPGNAPRARLV
jgi:hypothetical protein